jgi:hypothetical protein
VRPDHTTERKTQMFERLSTPEEIFSFKLGSALTIGRAAPLNLNSNQGGATCLTTKQMNQTAK